MYRSFFLVFVAVLFACLTPVNIASAQIVFTLNSVSFGVSGTSAGTLSGTFTTNNNTLNSASTLLTWNLVATSTGAINGHTFAGFNFTTSDSTAYFNVGNSGLLTGFELDSPLNSTTQTAADAVRVLFSTHLSTTGSTTVTPSSSYESEPAGGNRTVTGGSVAAVPEPSAWMLAFLATALFGGIRLRSRARLA